MQDISLSWLAVIAILAGSVVAVSYAKKFAKKRDAENAILVENQVLSLYVDGEWRAYPEIRDSSKPRSHFFYEAANSLVKKELLEDRTYEVSYLGLENFPVIKRYKITEGGLAHLKRLEDIRKSYA